MLHSGKGSMPEENYFLFCYLHLWFKREIEKGDIQVHSTRVKDCLIQLSIYGENLSGHFFIAFVV